MTVDDILPVEIMASAARLSGGDAVADPISMVPLVPAAAAADVAQIPAASVIESVPLGTLQLSYSRARPSERTAAWQRFVALRVDAQQAAAMEPILAPGMIAVIDRHYNSIAPYRAHQPTLFAIRHGGGVLLRYVELEDGRLILRPLASDCAVQLVAIAANQAPSDYIVGRVCFLQNEL